MEILIPTRLKTLLANEVIGRIGCNANGVTYVVPITYAYHDGYVYAHSKAGMKVQMMRLNPMVCFEIDKMNDLENWQSVVAWGRYEELKGNDQKAGLQKIRDRLLSMKLSETSLPSDDMENGHQNFGGQYKAIVYRIKLLEKTGKYEKSDYAVDIGFPAINSGARKLLIRASH